MVLFFPLLIGAGGYLAWHHRADAGGTGWEWFLAWSVAGFLMTFSFLAGLSIGLFVLPFAAAALIFASVRSPHLREASGFLAGMAGTLALVAILNLGTSS